MSWLLLDAVVVVMAVDVEIGPMVLVFSLPAAPLLGLHTPNLCRKGEQLVVVDKVVDSEPPVEGRFKTVDNAGDGAVVVDKLGELSGPGTIES